MCRIHKVLPWGPLLFVLRCQWQQQKGLRCWSHSHSTNIWWFPEMEGALSWPFHSPDLCNPSLCYQRHCTHPPWQTLPSGACWCNRLGCCISMYFPLCPEHFSNHPQVEQALMLIASRTLMITVTHGSNGKGVSLPHTFNHLTGKESMCQTGFNNAAWGKATYVSTLTHEGQVFRHYQWSHTIHQPQVTQEDFWAYGSHQGQGQRWTCVPCYVWWWWL